MRLYYLLKDFILDEAERKRVLKAKIRTDKTIVGKLEKEAELTRIDRRAMTLKAKNPGDIPISIWKYFLGVSNVKPASSKVIGRTSWDWRWLGKASVIIGTISLVVYYLINL